MFKRLKTIVLISGNGSNLQAIIQKCHIPETVEIDCVISDNPDAFGIKRAEYYSIPYMIIPQKENETKEKYSIQLADFIESQEPDLIVMAGFMKVLTKEYTEKLPHTINIHPSLLPLYPGLNTHKKVLMNKDKMHGVTIHWVTKELDAGPIITQASIQVYKHDTPGTLKNRIHRLEHTMYPYVITELAEGRFLWNHLS